jgi:quinol monooxygenase YgiN
VASLDGAASVTRETVSGEATATGAGSLIYVLAKVTVAPKHRNTFLDDARTLIASTRQEAGCRSYDLACSVTTPNECVFVERWDSRDALAAHKATPQAEGWLNSWGGLLETVETEIVHAAHVEGLRTTSAANEPRLGS